MNIICGIIGLILGIVFFVLLLDKIQFVFVNMYTLVFLFVICVGVGCALAYLVGWILIILLVIGVICMLFSNSSDDNKKDDSNNNNTQNKQ